MASDLAIAYDHEADGRWIAEIDALAGCMVYGSTREEARRKVVTLALEIVRDLVEHGEWGSDLPALSFSEAA